MADSMGALKARAALSALGRCAPPPRKKETDDERDDECRFCFHGPPSHPAPCARPVCELGLGRAAASAPRDGRRARRRVPLLLPGSALTLHAPALRLNTPLSCRVP
jgi:hypothetical protein